MVITSRAYLLLFNIGALFLHVKCCDWPFNEVAGRCLYFGAERTLNFFESFELCEFLESKLAKITTATQLKDIFEYIQLNDTLAETYWLGGTDKYLEDTWLYAVGEPVPRGTPFWATTMQQGQWNQLPNYNTLKNCLSLNGGAHFYFTDENCSEPFCPLCEKELGFSRKGGDEGPISLNEGPISLNEGPISLNGSEKGLLGNNEDDRRLKSLNRSEKVNVGSCGDGYFECYFWGNCIPLQDLCDEDLDCIGDDYDIDYWYYYLDWSDEGKICNEYSVIEDVAGTYGQISSPGFEHHSAIPNLNMTWTVSVDHRVATDESYLTVYFETFQIYSGAYLSIRDGPDSNSNEIAKYSTTEGLNQKVESSGSQLFFQYYTEGGIAHFYDGFLFTWTAENTQCEYNYVGTSGTISSVNYDGNYLGNIDCKWNIQSPPELTLPNTVVRLTILHLDTQPENDYLEIRDGDSTGPVIVSISGHTWPLGLINSTGPQIYLHFHADDDLVTNTGFELQWYTVVCPEPYLVVGELCIHFIWENLKWGEASISCQQIGGHLARINDPEHLRTIYSYVHTTGLEQDSFWIDGKGNKKEGSWLWQDNTTVPTGTPFWGLTGDGTIQEPDDSGNENCLVLLGDGFHYFRDADCNFLYRSICMTDIIKYL